MKLGVDRFLSEADLRQNLGRVGLLCNQASVDTFGEFSVSSLSKALGGQLKALFGPQHGFVSHKQDNMIESAHEVHPKLGIPIYSLYSETRIPTEEMLASIDTLLVDIQLSGWRVYTFKYTIAECLRAAAQSQKKVVVLDRPNPLGGVGIEGNILEKEAISFVGQFPIPMRHGLTTGEAAAYFNEQIGADLQVVTMEGWNAAQVWPDDKPWVLTSPNLPTKESLLFYPGMVLLEGTNISEGRGTTLPFQLIGAPYISDEEALVGRIQQLGGSALNDVWLRPTSFVPMYSKWQGQVCRGLQLHSTGPNIASYKLGIALISAFVELSEGKFEFTEPPYEYNYHEKPINLINGSLGTVSNLLNLQPNSSFFTQGLEEYKKALQDKLLYPRELSIL